MKGHRRAALGIGVGILAIAAAERFFPLNRIPP